jgi:GT2 family glycosyltransferase
MTVLDETRLSADRIAVIIASYNYGRYLAEAAESVVRQTRQPDEVLILDDASEEETTGEVGRFLSAERPDLIRYHRNETNLGIVNNFNRGVSMTSAEYVCILGADNRLRSDYLEKTSAALAERPGAAVAYTDFAFFGPRARIEYSKFMGEKPWEALENTFFVVRFPQFDEVARERLQRRNFIHGSSLYRRAAFDAVGGYREAPDGPEDHDLFRRMIQAGWSAWSVGEPLLEYRQHSRSQANRAAVEAHELHLYRKRYLAARRELDSLTVAGLIRSRVCEKSRRAIKSARLSLWRVKKRLRLRGDRP